MSYKTWKSLIESLPFRRQLKIKAVSDSEVINETIQEAYTLFKLQLITLDEYETLVAICKSDD